MFSDAPRLAEVVSKVMMLFVAVVGILSIIALSIAGILYLISAGNEEIGERAKRACKYGIIGLIVAAGSLIVLKTVESLLK